MAHIDLSIVTVQLQRKARTKTEIFVVKMVTCVQTITGEQTPLPEAPVRTCLLKPAKPSPFHPVICNLSHETLQYNKAEGKTGDLK